MSDNLEISLPSRIESVDTAAERAEEFVAANGLGDEFAYAVDLAVRESVANAIKHGNKFDEAKSVELCISAKGGELEILVRDHGTGFDSEQCA